MNTFCFVFATYLRIWVFDCPYAFVTEQNLIMLGSINSFVHFHSNYVIPVLLWPTLLPAQSLVSSYSHLQKDFARVLLKWQLKHELLVGSDLHQTQEVPYHFALNLQLPPMARREPPKAWSQNMPHESWHGEVKFEVSMMVLLHRYSANSCRQWINYWRCGIRSM